MLSELSIRGIALIDEAHLRLGPGLTVFTGETGAGKSILLDAIGLLLGGRASAELVRKGADSGRVEALFHLSDAVRPRVVQRLSEWGIEAEEELLISREVHVGGRSVCRINGQMATVQMLRELGSLLVQQHGQHEHHGLLQAEEQKRALDLYGNHQSLLAEVGQLYSEWSEVRRTLERMRMDEQERVRRIDMLRFQMEEIERVNPRPGEEDALREQRRLLQHVDRVSASLQTAVAALMGGDRNASGAVALMAEAAREVAAAADFDPRMKDAADLLETAQVHAEEAAHAVRRFLDRLEADPAELERVEERLAQIRALQRKYGATETDVLAYLQEIREEYNRLVNHEQETTELEARLAACERSLSEACDRLHERRRETARRMAAEVQALLRTLSMPSARFEIAVKRQTARDGTGFGADGADHVQFLFSANKGEELKPLQKVASGGELSRTLLAMKAALADVDEVDTLIFDEIDAGVSGQATLAIAEQMTRLAGRHQVLCVTHAAPIAAVAAEHFEIVKVETETHTITQVSPLDLEGRIRELARLIGAGAADETAVAHARALLERRLQH
ncbi:MAG: DNA repair protein RecN [Alicyclobacillus macrosporangiidus]|uniref:DNA repair protein RecN n=1 Tax=Alicyclobacillus macrosporangiidus TaxID=392015 RepID=UPI0026ED91F0|nr:DNA repair protein RecN [Alicyclobacillus macrosporangiidus]MCL6599846.1 DNA repair protein RecN [Alicyclobacillus macrosporangiidus]